MQSISVRFADGAPSALSGKRLPEFIHTLNQVYLANMKRVTDDLEWLQTSSITATSDEPWKNSKDALPRGLE